jgi:hypothetical protein
LALERGISFGGGQKSSKGKLIQQKSTNGIVDETFTALIELTDDEAQKDSIVIQFNRVPGCFPFRISARINEMDYSNEELPIKRLPHLSPSLCQVEVSNIAELFVAQQTFLNLRILWKCE